MAGTSDRLHLAAGALGVDLVPRVGGSMAAFRHGMTDLLRPLSAADDVAGNGLGVAMFPMVPYANRITGNVFDFQGRSYAFQPNNPPEKFNVHGTGWHRDWSLDRRPHLRRRRGLLVKMEQHVRTPLRMSLKTDLAKNADRRGSM